MKSITTLVLVLSLFLLDLNLPAQTLPSPLQNFSSSAWGASASASSSNGSNTPNLAIDGLSTTGWVGGTGKAYLIVSFSSPRAISEIHLGKGGTAPSGSSMPTQYTINLYSGATLLRTIVNETNNTQADATYELPGITNVTSVWLLVNATLSNNLPYVNQLDVSGPFIPTIMAPVPGQTINKATYAVRGYSQPGASVTVSVNGTPLTGVTADAGGWFSATTGSLTSGTATFTATATASTNTSTPSSALTASYSSTGTSTYALETREGAGVVFDEGTNEVLVNAGGQGSSVAYAITDENNNPVTSGTGTIDLSHGTAMIPLPSSAPGWYQIVTSTSPSSFTQTVAVLSTRAALPLTSRISSDVALAQTKAMVASGDQGAFTGIVSDYVGKVGYGYLRERISWNAVNNGASTNNWSAYDGYETNIIAQGQSVMPCVYSFPSSTMVNHHGSYRYVPDSLYTTYQWGHDLATHYSQSQFNGLIKGFEFQNEADYTTNNYAQTVNTIMAHQRAFYLGVKSANTNMLVMPNPPAYVTDAQNELQNLRGEAADVFTFHWYPAGTGTTNLANLLSTMGTNMKTITSLLENRSAWMSECGYIGSSAIYGTANTWSADEQIQADFISKMGPLAMSNNIDRPFSFIFPFYNASNGSGMLRYTSFGPRPAVNASEITAQMLQTATYYGTLVGGSNITGLVFQNANGSFILEVWAANSSGVGNFTLPNGVTDVNVVDYLGRPTDTGSTTVVAVQSTAKFVTLSNNTSNNNAIKSSLFSTAANYPAPNYAGVAPSPVIMAWHFTPDLPCKTSYFEDYYDVVNNTSATGSLEICNTSSTTPFTGTITVNTSNQRWGFNVTSGSLSVSNLAANGGTAYVGFTLTAPALTDTVRLEARTDDSTGHTSSAAEIFETTGSSTPVNAIVEDGTQTITIPCYVSTSGVSPADQNSPVQNYLGYDGHLAWTPGTDGGGVTYEQALPSTGTLTYSATEQFKAPGLGYTGGFKEGATYYYVWIKAKAPTTGGVFFNVPGSTSTTEVGGFNTSTWTWSRTAVYGGRSGLAEIGTGTIVSGTVRNYVINLWPSNDGVQIADIVIRTDSSNTPPGF